MSQIYRGVSNTSSQSFSSQVNHTHNSKLNAQLNEILDYFIQKNEEINQNNFTQYKLNNDDYDLEIESYLSSLNTYDEVNVNIEDFAEKFSKFTKILTPTVSYDQIFIDKLLFKNIHYIIFSCVKEHVSKLIDDLYSISDQIVCNLNSVLKNLELIYDYLLNCQSAKIKYEQVSVFLISTFNSVLLVNKYFKRFPASDLEKQSTLLMYKVFNLFESKLLATLSQDFNTNSSKTSKSILIKTCKFFAYFINNTKDTKLALLIWRIMSKLLITNKLLVNLSHDSDLIMFQDAKIVLHKTFQTLHHHLSLDLNFIRESLQQLNDTQLISSPNNTNNFTVTENIQSQLSSQMRFENNITQDTIKVIKLSSRLFMVFRSILSVYFDYFINDEKKEQQEIFYLKITDILSIVNYTLFYDLKLCLPLNEEEQNKLIESENENNNKINSFAAIKTEYCKEFSNGFENLFKFIETNQSYEEFLFSNGDYYLFY
jgi:hypothetical protein